MNKLQLSEPQRRLIERFQEINFGAITFEVRAGHPDLDRPHIITRTHKLSAAPAGPRPEIRRDDFVLRQEQITLLQKLGELPDGARVKVKVVHGLPGPAIDVEEPQLA